MTSLLAREARITTTMADSVMSGQAVNRYFSTAGGMREGAEAIARIARDLGCSDLMAVSGAAAGLVGVTALLFEGNFAVVSEADIKEGDARRILLVETVVISGLNVRHAIKRLKSAGVEWVGVLVLHSIADALDLEEADELRVA